MEGILPQTQNIPRDIVTHVEGRGRLLLFRPEMPTEDGQALWARFQTVVRRVEVRFIFHFRQPKMIERNINLLDGKRQRQWLSSDLSWRTTKWTSGKFI